MLKIALLFLISLLFLLCMIVYGETNVYRVLKDLGVKKVGTIVIIVISSIIIVGISLIIGGATILVALS